MINKKILILSSAETAGTTSINDDFVTNLQRRIGDKVSIEWRNYHSIDISISNDGTEVTLDDGRSLKDYDFVYFKSFFRYSEMASVIAYYLKQNDITFVSSELLRHGIDSKLSQLNYLSYAGLPIPSTLFMLNDQWVDSYEKAAKKFGLPFIFKSVDGSTGRENYLIKSEKEFKDALEFHKLEKLEFIAQEFIPNNSDLRVLIVGDEIKMIIKRQRVNPEETHLNNTSQGATASLISVDTLSSYSQEICLRAASILDREIAGVDLLFSEIDNSPYILEVNASPQIGSGAFVEEKLDIYSDYFKNVVGIE